MTEPNRQYKDKRCRIVQAYENTGLTPADITAMQTENKRMTEQIQEFHAQFQLESKREDENAQVDYEYEFCKDCSDYGEPNGCNRASGECDVYVLFTAIAAECDKLRNEKRLLRRQLAAYRQAEQDGVLVRLPDKLVAPYELNARYWICGWDLESCALIIQDRVLKKQMESAAFQEVEPAAHTMPDPYKP